MICFACIVIASTLASSLACACLLFLSLLCLFCLCSALLFMFVCYAIKCAPCSVNAGRQKQHHGERIAERRQGERLRRACLACLIAFAIGAYCFIMRGLCLRGATPPPAGGTFSVRFTGKNELNRSCSSPQPIVPTANYLLCIIQTVINSNEQFHSVYALSRVYLLQISSSACVVTILVLKAIFYYS